MEKPFALIVVMMTAVVAEAGTRFPTSLDNGAVVQVDNFSSWSNEQVANLVRLADRSTKDGGMFLRISPVKGLISSDDRVFVNNNYLAWFDVATRGGGLSGYWTLDPLTASFRHLRQVIPGVYWAHNELVRGSASPYQQTNFWDTNAPPIEHSVGIYNQTAQTTELMMHEVGILPLPGNSTTILFDGRLNPADPNSPAAYGTSTIMKSINTLHTDIVDFNEANGVSNYLESQLAYLPGPTSIVVVWRVRPVNGGVAPCPSPFSGGTPTNGCGANAYYHLWANYSFDSSYPYCGAAPWPASVWGEPGYAVSNVATNNYENTAFVAPDTITAVVKGSPCAGTQVRKTGPPSPGTWLKWGESPTLAQGTPAWRVTRVSSPAGYGQEMDLDHLIFFNETTDGVWGGGGGKWSPALSSLEWRITSYEISTQ